MSSLWTPDGERHVAKASPEPGAAASGSSAADAGPTDDTARSPIDLGDPLRAAAKELGIDLDTLSDEDRAQLQTELAEMMQVRRQVAATPASEMVANHLMRLFDLATIYLESTPPSFSDAATVIESFRAVVENVGGRLGEHQAMLIEALSQLQMVFVQVKQAAETGVEPASDD